jgi:hypothetical protein
MSKQISQHRGSIFREILHDKKIEEIPDDISEMIMTHLDPQSLLYLILCSKDISDIYKIPFEICRKTGSTMRGHVLYLGNDLVIDRCTFFKEIHFSPKPTTDFVKLKKSRVTSISIHTNGLKIGFDTFIANLPSTVTSLTLQTDLQSSEFELVMAHLPKSIKHLDLGSFSCTRDQMSLITHSLPTRLESLCLFSDFSFDRTREFVRLVPNSLQTLDLSFSKIQPDAFPLLAAGFPTGLKHLNLDHVSIGDASFASIAVYLGCLETLLLSNTKITSPSIRLLSLYLSKRVKVLDLSCNNIGSLGSEYLSMTISHFLESLDVSSCQIGNKGMIALSPGLSSTLLELNLSSNQLQDSGIIVFAKHIPIGLRALRLDRNRIGVKGMKALCRMMPAGMIDLGLGACCNSKAAAKQIGYCLSKLHRLRTLKFHNNHLDDAGYKIMMHRLPDSLVELNLELNTITHFGILSAVDVDKPGLGYLNLSENRIGDKGCVSLGNKYENRGCQIDLCGNPISERVKSIMRKHPHITFF